MADRRDPDRTDPALLPEAREPAGGPGNAAVATAARRPSRRRAAPAQTRSVRAPETSAAPDPAPRDVEPFAQEPFEQEPYEHDADGQAAVAQDPFAGEPDSRPDLPPDPAARQAAGRGAVSLVVGGRMPRRQRRRLEQAARLRARQADGRYRLVYDVRGPKVRLGVLWAALVAGSLYWGGVATAMLFAPVAGVAALQGAQAWRAAGARRGPLRPLSGALGALLPLAAIGGAGGLGAAVLVAVGACLAGGVAVDHRAGGHRMHPPRVIAVASATLRSGFFVGLAAGCVVLVRQLDSGAAWAMVVLVCAYEVGDYLVGSGSTTVAEGPAAGCIGVLVATFALSVVRPEPFASTGSVWAMGVATALCCPLGQLGASLTLPSGGTFAPALRRLDSFLVVAPLWAMVLLVGALG